MKIFCRRLVFKWVCNMAATIALMLAGGMFLSMTVLGKDTIFHKNREVFREQKEYYKSLEQEYMKDMQNFLASQGYADSGVTMNRVIEEDGSLQYIVTIYHKGIVQLDVTGRGQLLSKCERIEFADKECSFCHKILEVSS